MSSQFLYGILIAVAILFTFLFIILPLILLKDSKGFRNLEIRQVKNLKFPLLGLSISYLFYGFFLYGVKFVELVVRHVKLDIKLFNNLTAITFYIAIFFYLVSFVFLLKIIQLTERKSRWMIVYLLAALGFFANLFLIVKLHRERLKISEAK